MWVRLVGGPPPPRPRSCPPSPPAAARPPPGRRQRGGLAGASASFPSGSLPCAARGWCVFFLPGGGRGVVARRPSRHPWRGALALTVAGSRCRVTGRCRRSARASSSPRFLASRVRPAPVRVPSCRVPARRFKDPRGVAPPPPGSGGGGARRGSLLALLRLLRPLPPSSPLPRPAVGVCVSSPPWAPVGPAPRARLVRLARSLPVPGAVSPVVVRLFPLPTLCFFFRSFLVPLLAGRPEANPPEGACAVVSRNASVRSRPKYRYDS